MAPTVEPRLQRPEEELKPQLPGSPLSGNVIDDPPEHDTATRDFGFLPIPQRLRYDPDFIPIFGWGMNLLFAIASTFGGSHLLLSKGNHN